MRDFARIPPSAWQSDLKKLRGDLEAIAVWMYLQTSPQSSMIGIYPCPVMFIAYDLGTPLEGAWKGLRRVIEAGLASYDEERDLVWVHDMAVLQIGAHLKPADNKIKNVAKLLLQLPKCPLTLGFYARYRDAYCLSTVPDLAEYERGLEGASDTLGRGSEQEKEKDKEQEHPLRKEERLAPAPARELPNFGSDLEAGEFIKANCNLFPADDEFKELVRDLRSGRVLTRAQFNARVARREAA